MFMLKSSNLTRFLLSLVLMSGVLSVSPVLALNLKDGFSSSTGSLSNFATQSGYTNQTKTPEYYVGLLLNGLFSILGIVAIAMLIYSGFVWMTARGNESKVEKAKENIIDVIMGLIFIIGSYALTTFLLKIFS